MPNGRLARCILECRKPAEVYHNTSGNAASVSLFANAISTNTNTEISVVVGIASTTLRAQTTSVNADVGTFKSMSNTVYTCDICSNLPSGVSTYSGINKVASAGTHYCDNNNCWLTYNGAPPVQTQPFGIFVDGYGNITKTIGGCGTSGTPGGGGSGTLVRNCLKEGCCVHHLWGGNEIQNPAIWMREYPASCRNDGTPFWGGKVIGWLFNCCCSCCSHEEGGRYGVSGAWYPIKGVNVGMGHSACAVTNALQLLSNWCCCCGQVGANKSPINAFSGCPSCYNGTMECVGNACWYQFCRMCACNCTEGGGAHRSWNYYSLDNDFYCCCDGFNGNDAQCFRCATRLVTNAPGVSSCCLTKAGEGEVRTPPWFVFYRCHGQSEGCFRQGAYTTCWHPGNSCCGYNCWQQWGHGSIQSGQSNMYWPYQTWGCYCHVCCSGTFMVNSWCTTQTCKISPFTFIWGMTNCAFAAWIGTDNVGSPAWRHARYYITYPDVCYMRRCAATSNCYFYEVKEFCVALPESTNNNYNEMPIKYLAWNCNVTNKHGTKGCVYIMSRSACPGMCGIFTYDVHDYRVQLGPFCGCTNQSWQCQNQLCFYGQHLFDVPNSDIGWDIKKVGDWPKSMSCSKYLGPTYKEMCVSCLYRSDNCTWNLQLYNFQDLKWDGFTSNDLITWTNLPDPYSQRVSDILTTTVTADYACIVDDCNCFFANIDCSGLIDYKLSMNQYERTGIVLSDGDRIMVNNNGDVKTSFQVWGYEG